MELEAKKSNIVDDGAHKGMITKVTYRTQPFEYTDVHIEFKNGDKQTTISAGYPTCLTPESMLGRLLKRFGCPVEVGEKYDPEKILVNTPCKFMTMTEETKNGNFPKVISDSVKMVV